jgi:hypothetical protein
MSRIFASALLLSVLLLSVPLPDTLAEWSVSAISEQYAPSVVRITALDQAGKTVGSGSGFFLNTRGSVATNYHVLEKSSKALVENARGEEGEVMEITHADPSADLLIAETSFRNTLPVTLGDSSKILVGESVLVMGNSPGWEGTLSLGAITHVRKAGGLTLIQVSAPILPGCSGAPVFNISGEVIGVATAFLDTAHFVLPVNSLRSLKAHRSPVNALREASVKIEASLVDNTLVELLVKEEARSSTEKAWGMPLSAELSLFTVHFKSGKSVLCERAWAEGRTLYLVAAGKPFAVGYDLDLIDVNKSFPR